MSTFKHGKTFLNPIAQEPFIPCVLRMKAESAPHLKSHFLDFTHIKIYVYLAKILKNIKKQFGKQARNEIFIFFLSISENVHHKDIRHSANIEYSCKHPYFFIKKLRDVLQEREGASFEQFWMILKHFELYLYVYI